MNIRCEFCGTEFNSIRKNCPNCGASCGGNKELEAKTLQEEKLTSEMTRMAASDFDRAHPYNEHLTPKHRNIIKALALLIGILMVIGVIVLLIILTSNAR